jgi:hypothetical protein
VTHTQCVNSNIDALLLYFLISFVISLSVSVTHCDINHYHLFFGPFLAHAPKSAAWNCTTAFLLLLSTSSE